jgi:hypothetical protein
MILVLNKHPNVIALPDHISEVIATEETNSKEVISLARQSVKYLMKSLPVVCLETTENLGL